MFLLDYGCGTPKTETDETDCGDAVLRTSGSNGSSQGHGAEGGEMSLALELLGFGPRGGDLERPASTPERRRKPLNAPIDAATGLPGLHRFEDTATQGLKNELPWHAMAAIMLLHGYSNTEVAAAAGVHPNSVTVLRQQRWFQEKVATLVNEQSVSFTGLFAGEMVASFQKLVELRDFAESERVQLSATVAMIEHTIGKPLQRSQTEITSKKHFDNPEQEILSLEEELSALRKAQSQPVEEVPVPPTDPTNSL